MLQADFIDRRWRHPALLPLFFFVLALLLRSFSFVAAVIDTDEGLYMLQAREWLEGRWPITAVWDMHPVGAPALVAVAMALFGHLPQGRRGLVQVDGQRHRGTRVHRHATVHAQGAARIVQARAAARERQGTLRVDSRARCAKCR